MCQVSGVTCRLLLVICHLSYVTNANSHSHGPSPRLFPHYAQQDAAADLDIDPSTIKTSVTFTQLCNFYVL